MAAPPKDLLRVLIVEDDPAQAGFLARALAGEGREVLIASDAESGLAMARTGVELLVADYKLPGMNGVELVKRLRAEKIIAPILVISAEATVAIAVDARKAGALDFVQNPFDLDC